MAKQGWIVVAEYVDRESLRRSAKVTHLSFLKLTHPKNRIENRIRGKRICLLLNSGRAKLRVI
jgi:hypothetical protein